MPLRPAESFVHGDGHVVVLDGRICAELNKAGLDRLRGQVRGRDAQLYQVLLAIRLVALSGESSSCGTQIAPLPEPESCSQQQLKNTVSTTTAANVLGITDRAIRRAIAEKRLTATQDDGGRYRITHDDLAAFAAQRTT